MGSKDRQPRASCVVLVDVVCILLVGVPCLLLMLRGEPYVRGFFCSDLSLRHPYRESTVSVLMLLSISYGLPFLIFCLVESSNLKLHNSFDLSRLGIQLYNVFGVFVFGAFVNQLLTDTTKFTIGRLRPHFLQVCNPVYGNINCSIPNFNYITNYSCQGEPDVSEATRDKRLHDARLSFVSGHASLSVFSMSFSIIYLQYQMVGRDYRLTKPLIQVGCALFALFTSLTRISDYKHHPGDVLGGAVVGIVSAAVTYKFFIARKHTKRDRSTSTTSLVPLSTSRIYTEEVQQRQN